MARRRGRRLAMTAAGLATAAAPLVLSQQGAGAAVTSASGQQTIRFTTTGGQDIECTAGIFAQHNTNDAAHPTLDIGTSLGGAGCFDNFQSTVTATYRDSQGDLRTTEFHGSSLLGGRVEGAYTATSARLDVEFFNCDPNRSGTCTATATASPK